MLLCFSILANQTLFITLSKVSKVSKQEAGVQTNDCLNCIGDVNL